MKLTLTLLGLFTATAAFAADYYVNDGWPGEYPLNFEVKKEVSVKVRPRMEIEAPATEDCTLPVGAKYGPQQDNAEATPYTRSVITRYKAKKDLELSEMNDKGEYETVKVPKGSTVEELTYLSEGFCRIRVGGREFDESCPSNSEEDYEELAGNPKEHIHQRWLNLSCPGLEGRRWLLVDDELEALFENGTLESLPAFPNQD